MSNIIEKFNNQFEQFLLEIKKTFPEFIKSIDKLYIFPNNNTNYLDMFYENIKENVSYILEKNEILFSENNKVIEGINFYKVWNDESIDDTFKQTIWKYIYTLYIFAFEYKQEKDLGTIIHEITSSDKEVSDDYKMFMNVLTKFKDEFINISSNIQDMVQKNIESDEQDNPTESVNSAIPNIFGGVIGNLAQELANEINPDDLNLDNPADLLKGLMNPDENDNDNKLMNIVKNITGSIESKINSGDINQEQLFSEAASLMGKLQGNSDDTQSENNPNDIFSNLFSQIANQEVSGDSPPLQTNEEVDEQSTPNQLPQGMNLPNPEQLSQMLQGLGDSEQMTDMMANVQKKMNPKVQQNIELQQRRVHLRKKLEQSKKKLNKLDLD